MTQDLAASAGALLTLASCGVLAAGGYLLALRLLGDTAARENTLELATAWLLSTTALGVGIALALGACGALRIELALPLALACTVALLAAAGRRRDRQPLALPAAILARRLTARLRQHPALSVLALHAIGCEALRGLIRPPLSWDALMYHLLLAATWLQRHDLAPVFGAYPTNYYGYTPGNGEAWLWWWMAPAHSEIYANLAFLPQWLLLACATGAVARRLGARRLWPLAAFVVASTPTVVRFAATQYVDIFTAACLLAGCVFGLAWLREPREPRRPRAGLAILAGMGIGLAAGAKVLGLVYGGALAALLLSMAVVGGSGRSGASAGSGERGNSDGGGRRRQAWAATAGVLLVTAAAFGSFFYLRNVARGIGPLALQCEGLPRRQKVEGLPRLPRPNSVAALPHQMWVEGRLPRALLGTVENPGLPFEDLGLGPQALLVALGLPALAALPRTRWREATVAGGLAAAQIAFWVTVPYAASGHVFANVRYLLAAVGIAVAGGVAAAEYRGVSRRGLTAVAVALAAQDLLQLHTRLSDGPRLAVAVADLAAVGLALYLRPGRRAASRAGGAEAQQPGRAEPWRQRRAALVAAGLAVGVLGIAAAAPRLERFRAADRTRAFEQEYTAHGISTSRYAAGWDWLDRHGGSGTVSVVSSPDTFFVYPAMGAHLERRAVYVNVNVRNLAEAADYPFCQPRIEPDFDAWVANLRRAEVRWLHHSRTPPYPFPVETGWARAHPELFARRFADATNEIYELLAGPAR